MYLCLNLTSGQIGIAIPITRPVVTFSSTVAIEAAEISAMNKTNSRQYVHFIHSKLENSSLLLDSNIECSSTNHVPYGGMGEHFDCTK
jgi:hypothetical protein